MAPSGKTQTSSPALILAVVSFVTPAAICTLPPSTAASTMETPSPVASSRPTDPPIDPTEFETPPDSDDDTEGHSLLNAEFVSSERGHLYEDRSGSLWFANEALYRLETEGSKVSLRKTELHLPENLTTSLVFTTIFEGPDNSVWFVTTSGPLRRLPGHQIGR